MDKIYIAIPTKLRVNLCENRHTKRMFDIYKDHEIELETKVMSVVAFTEYGSRKILKANVQQYIESLWAVQDGYLKLTDFEYRYSVNSSNENGGFWTSACGTTTQIF